MSKTTEQTMAAGMRLTVNGEDRRLPQGSTIADLLSLLKIEGGKVAVEHNRAIAPRSQFASTALSDGDVLEIVRFVGGG